MVFVLRAFVSARIMIRLRRNRRATAMLPNGTRGIDTVATRTGRGYPDYVWLPTMFSHTYVTLLTYGTDSHTSTLNTRRTNFY